MTQQNFNKSLIVPPDASLEETITMMNNLGVKVLSVVKGQKIIGIVSERDIRRKLAGNHKEQPEISVKEVMFELLSDDIN